MSMTFPPYTSVIPLYQEGPVTYTVSVAVTGGMLVESDGASPAQCRPASAGSQVCIGVALQDAVPSTTSQVPTVPGWSGPSVNAALLPNFTAVADEGTYALLYAASAVFGQRLKCAANGQVTPWVSGTDNPELIVAICADPAGVTVVSPPVEGVAKLTALS